MVVLFEWGEWTRPIKRIKRETCKGCGSSKQIVIENLNIEP